jgi:hypothetical protein
MDLDQIEYVYTFGLDGGDVIEALANDGAAYAAPVSFHFDGSSLYLRLTGDGSDGDSTASTSPARCIGSSSSICIGRTNS